MYKMSCAIRSNYNTHHMMNTPSTIHPVPIPYDILALCTLRSAISGSSADGISKQKESPLASVASAGWSHNQISKSVHVDRQYETTHQPIQTEAVQSKMGKACISAAVSLRLFRFVTIMTMDRAVASQWTLIELLVL